MNDFMKKYTTFAIVIGGLLGISVLVVSFNLLNAPSNGDDPSIPDQGMVFVLLQKWKQRKIIYRM